MEQRIGSGSQPLEGAGFDPAFIPGLTSPASAAPKGAKKEDVAEDGDLEETVLEDVEEPEAEVEGEDDRGGDRDDRQDDDEPDADGPVFEASDRRARIVADRAGVRLSLDDQECEFRWDEIGAVETEAPRFGKRYTVTVHTPDRRWYPIEIEATARSRFTEWDEQLDAVLDAYFEDGAEGAGSAEDAEESDAS